MSKKINSPESAPIELKIIDNEYYESLMGLSSSSDNDQFEDPQGSEIAYDTSSILLEIPLKSAQVNKTNSIDELTLSGHKSVEFSSTNVKQEPNLKAEEKKSRLSSRMEYLARPKKDFLDREGFERVEGVLPEKSLPSWFTTPLPIKLPAGNYPYEIATTKLGKNVYLTPPGIKMDLLDENNLHPPKKVYSSLHDPYLKKYFKNPKILKHLIKNGYASKSGRVISSLRDVNDYREYSRRILAERAQQKYRDEHEKEKKERERRMKKEIKEEDEKLQNERAQTCLRFYIKNAVSSVREKPMETQRERDKKTLNKEIQLQMKWKLKAQEEQERYKHHLNQHIYNKYVKDDRKKALELERARLDVERIDEICHKREKERLDRKQKLEDFYLRKAEEQTAWVEKGLELEKKWNENRKKNIDLRRTRVLTPELAGKKIDADEGTSSDYEVNERNKKVPLEETLGEQEMSKKKDRSRKTASSEKDKVGRTASSSTNTDRKPSSSKSCEKDDSNEIEPGDREMASEKTQSAQILSQERDRSRKSLSSEKDNLRRTQSLNNGKLNEEKEIG